MIKETFLTCSSFGELHRLYQAGVHSKILVEFTKKIDELETYAEKDMRAELVSITWDEQYENGDYTEDVYILVFDFSQFAEYNKKIESPVYYSADDELVTASEVGYYPKDGIEKIYFSDNTDPKFITAPIDYFTSIPSKYLRLYEDYLKSKCQLSYVRWLEMALVG